MANNFKRDLDPNPNSNEKLFGFYRGIVLDNRDLDIDTNDKNYGRIKVHIPDLMDDPEVGLWAYPGNNPMGGRTTESISTKKDSNGGKQEFCGSLIVPPNNSGVWIFFEAGDPNRPYYFNALDIKNHEVPPEIKVDSDKKPEERWLLFRSPHGRVIMISDDPDCCRVEITGKKRTTPGNTNSHVYDLSNNQKTILIDDKEGQEKILVEDEKGNYVNIRTSMNDIDVHANNIIRLYAGSALYINAPHLGITCNSLSTAGGDVSCNVSGNFDFMTNGRTSMRAGGSFYIDSPDLQSNAGLASSPGTSGSEPTSGPNGSRNE